MIVETYDLIVIGSGPGGYVAAIRAAQLGMRVAIVEREELGGICLNWGCIPTKALLKSAQVWDYCKHASTYGIQITEAKLDFERIIKRSREIAAKMGQGVDFLLKKHRIMILEGYGKVMPDRTVSVVAEGDEQRLYRAHHIIIATGARSRSIPALPIDGKHVIAYREALSLTKQPNTMVIVGGGAIGCEFAYLYHTLGTKVTLIETRSRLLPLEDEGVSKQIFNSFTKSGMEVYTSATVEQLTYRASDVNLSVHTSSGPLQVSTDIVVVSTGIQSNIENIGLEEHGILVEEGKISVDAYYQTTCKGIYAIGDVIKGPALAHVASAEAIICVEKMAGLTPTALDYNNIPSCMYMQPEVASVGYTEEAAKAAGYTIKTGLFPFAASGKAHASGHSEGFVKVIFDAQYGAWLGAHMVGAHVTELIAEVVVARKLETTAYEIHKSVHPHPTLSEAIMEAVASAYGESIHI